MVPRFAVLAGMVLSAASIASADQGQDFKFTFNRTAPNYTEIKDDTAYSDSTHYGYLTPPTASGTTASTFAVDVPEGNYDVDITFGNSKAPTSTTVKAEQRRLVVEKIDTNPGDLKSVKFTINVHTTKISTGGDVAMRGNGPLTPDWDNHLTFEFNGTHPGVTALTVSPDPSAVTVFVCGDSTVTDQGGEPWCSWGQMLPRFLGPGVAVANYAESGLTLTTFEKQRRLDKILTLIKKGDYVFIQFGHNDQKDKAPGSGPFTSYKANLKSYIDRIKAKGGQPVIVTPMERRRWLGTTPQPTLADFAAGATQAATEAGVPLIDLNAMSLKFYTALGPDGTTKAFVHYPANTFPGQAAVLKDDTHFNNYGAYELSRCIVEGIKAKVPALDGYLRKDVQPFDPSKPDSPDTFDVPFSPSAALGEKPAGS